MAGPFLRGSIALAVVLVAGLAVHAVAPSPTLPPPALSFGDHAEYDVSIVDLDTGRQWQGDEPRRVGVEVGAASTVAGPDGRPVLATPLEFRFAVPSLGGEPGQVGRTFWVGPDGRVVAVADQGSGSVARPAPLGAQGGPTLPVGTDAAQSVSWRDLRWSGPALPCGFGLPSQDARADVVPAPHAEGAAGATCQVERQAGSPWPTTVVAPLSGLLGSPGPGRLAHRLDLAEEGRSLGAWSSPAAVAALPPAPLVDRGLLGPAGQGPGEFPLAEAFEALRAAPTDAAARDLMDRHPDAYLAYARSYHAVDATQQHQSAWHLVFVGGTERVERAVVLEPGALPLLPPAVRVVPVSALEYPVDPAPSVFPPSGLAPATLPALDGLRSAFAAATGREATTWGFAIACRSRSCFEVDTRIQMLDEGLGSAGPSAARWQRSLEESDRLVVDGAATLLALEHVAFGQPVPNLLAAGTFEPNDRAAPGPRVAFPFPSAPAAATVGAIGLIAAGLAAAWPVVKLYIPLFSRIEASRMLDHPVRRRVHDLVHEEPGIHSRQVATRLGIAGNTAHHHLERLVGAGYLGERRIAGYHCYFPRGGLDERLQDAVPVLKSRGAQAVLLAIEAQGAPSFRSLIAATGLGYATVHHHAERLWKAGVVSSERDGKARRFRLTELGRRVAEQAHATLDRFPTLPKNASELDGTA